MTDPNRPVTGYPAPNGNPPPPPLSYASGPPPAYYNNNHQQPYYNTQQNYYPDPYAPQRATFLRRILGFVIAAIIITGTILFIIWLILRPSLPAFRVDSFSVSNLNVSSSTSVFSGVFDLRFTVHNPNKKLTVSYEQISADIFYNYVYLAQNTLPPFTQTTKNETALRAVFSALDTYVGSDAVDEINQERGKGGNVGFIVRMVMRVGFKTGAWRARPRYLKVFCGGLMVGLGANGANGTMTGGPRQCRAGF